MSLEPEVVRIGQGGYRVVIDGRARVVYVAGPSADRWVHCDGRVYRRPFERLAAAPRRPAGDTHESLTAPMPATVRKILVEPGASVRKGDTLVVLEAMKMELPVRANGDATVANVLCSEGELVQPGALLVELK